MDVTLVAPPAELLAPVGCDSALCELAGAGIVGSAASNATTTLGAPALSRPIIGIGLRTATLTAAVVPLVLAQGAARRLGRVGGAVLLIVYVVLLFLAPA